ncbi:hypothetical protein ACFL4N_05970 [Thermodesulfobacteriota bacterium]
MRGWDEEEDWHKWHASEERSEIQEKIEALLGRKTDTALMQLFTG